MEAKVGMLERFRRILGGSPSEKQSMHGSNQAGADPYQPHLDMLRDTARNLCSDAWLANRLEIEVKNEGGKATLRASPQESMPYIKAAYAMMQPGLPEDVKKLFVGLAS